MRKTSAILLVLTMLVLPGCKTPGGKTPEERRAYTQDMKEDALAEWYKAVPDSKSKMDRAVGYGVFNSMASALFIGGTANGYGVVTNNSTHEETYMRAFSASAGLGFGIKDYRAIILFYDADTFNRFVTSGWDFGGEASAEIASEGEKESAAAAGSVQSAMEIYELTREGIFLRAAVKATKVWPVKDLNE